MANEVKKGEEPADGALLNTPYGPHHGHVDDAAGGADSSPLDDLSSDERQAIADEAKRKNRGSGDTLNN